MVLQGDSLVVPSESYEKVYIKYSKATLCIVANIHTHIVYTVVFRALCMPLYNCIAMSL